MAERYSDETLMAFADGVLDEPLFSAVAEAIEQDEALTERLEQLVTGGALARNGFAALIEPVPPTLEASVRAMVARKNRTPFWMRQITLPWFLPIGGVLAASVAAVVVAAMTLQPAATMSWGGIDAGQLQAALDSVPSGAKHDLGHGRMLYAVASFTDSAGNLCREFEVPGYVMVACRAESAWQVNMAVANGKAGGYQTASGLSALDAYLTEIGASAPLLDTEERKALSGD